MHLGENRNVIDTRIGARVGEHDETILEIKPDAIRHPTGSFPPTILIAVPILLL
jgi:hypothetical protein